jgi:Galactose oxidase, central domain
MSRPISRRVAVQLAPLLLLVAMTVGLVVPTGSVAGTSGHGSVALAGSSSASRAVAGGSAPSSWQNLSGSVGASPENRSISQAAYSPALGATILFGGYNGVGGNYALGDTWSFANNSWTPLSPTVNPTPRWGATMVYDPQSQALVMFGGRNATAFFNDTWQYNSTGWNLISTTSAPSPRYDYGLTYDPILGAVLLYGGGTGNNPAGTFTNFVFYNDTWTYQSGVWTNITSTAGAGPVGRLLRGQMAYDALDGYVLLTGGYSYVALGGNTPCSGYVEFNSTWGETWEFAGGSWSRVLPAANSPPPGMGVIWYDAEANETLYYQGMWLAAADQCDVGGNVVWSFAGGNWTLVSEGNVSAPAPREQPVFVDDETDHEQVVFGGEAVANASEFFANYLNDTWTYQPTWVTFEPLGAPAGTKWQVSLAGTSGESTGKSLLFVVAPGTYTYHVVARSSHAGSVAGQGTFSLVHGPRLVTLVYNELRAPPASPANPWAPLDALIPALAGGAIGAMAIGGWAWTATTRRRTALRQEGETLVRAIVSESKSPPPTRPR